MNFIHTYKYILKLVFLLKLLVKIYHIIKKINHKFHKFSVDLKNKSHFETIHILRSSSSKKCMSLQNM